MRFINHDHIKIKHKDKVFKFPAILFSALSISKERVDKKWDNLILITGEVGSGKSTLAKGIAGVYQILNNKELTLDSFTWNSQGIVDFTDRTDNETEPIVFDEAIMGGTGRDSLSRVGQELKRALVTKRRKRHMYVMLVDELHEYNKKIISRASFLIDCRTLMARGEQKRGYFKIYNKKELTEIYWLLKKNLIREIKEYKGTIKPFYEFSNYENIFINEEEYENKKIEETNQQDEQGKIVWTTNKVIAFHLWSKGGMKQVEIADRVGVVANTMSTWVREFNKYSSQQVL